MHAVKTVKTFFYSGTQKAKGKSDKQKRKPKKERKEKAAAAGRFLCYLAFISSGVPCIYFEDLCKIGVIDTMPTGFH